VAIAVRGAAVREQHGDLVQAFRRLAPEVEHHGGRLQIGARTALLRVHEVGKLDRVLDEEHRRIVAHQVPVAFFRIKADSEAARIALGVGAAALAAHAGKAHERPGGFADLVEQFGLGVCRNVVRDGKGAVSARTFRMHHALGNALAVEVLEFFDQVEVLQEQRTARAGAEGILVIGDGDTGCRGQLWMRWRLLAHAVSP
jgi:hypothetical protein